jgi:hypothetical protein
MVRLASLSEARAKASAQTPTDQPVVLDTPKTCQDAQQFHQWVLDNIFTPLPRDAPSLGQLDRAELLLQRKYHEWRLALPREHRDYVSKTKTGHRCLYRIYVECYEQLRELRLTRPRTKGTHQDDTTQQIFGLPETGDDSASHP